MTHMDGGQTYRRCYPQHKKKMLHVPGPRRRPPAAAPAAFFWAAGNWCACIKQSGPSVMACKTGDTLGAYTLGELAGTGRFGVVFRASGGGGAAAVAIKVPKDSSHARELADEEITMLRAVAADRSDCPLVRLVDVVPPRHIVFEHMDGGDLDDVVLAWKELLPLYGMACRGLAWLHAHGHIHCDIKPENMLVNRARTELRIADIGNAQRGGLNKLPRSTFYYRAPETLLRLAPYGAGVDVWALACCMYETFTGEILFNIDGLTEEDESCSSVSDSEDERSSSSSEESEHVQWSSSSDSETDEETEKQETLAHLGQLQALCGPLPRAWRKSKRRFFNARGDLFPFDPPPPFASLASKMEHDCPPDSARNAPAALALLQACLRYKTRPSPQALEAALAAALRATPQ